MGTCGFFGGLLGVFWPISSPSSHFRLFPHKAVIVNADILDDEEHIKTTTADANVEDEIPELIPIEGDIVVNDGRLSVIHRPLSVQTRQISPPPLPPYTANLYVFNRIQPYQDYSSKLPWISYDAACQVFVSFVNNVKNVPCLHYQPPDLVLKSDNQKGEYWVAIPHTSGEAVENAWAAQREKLNRVRAKL
ncbi:hypothetical protein B0H11DRAFT_1934681 [Mycena galericulata]|nr:hypothetical protein B0H11DRAFT_1934681 [Mycena galericulata]